MSSQAYSDFLETKIRLFCSLNGNPPDSLLGIVAAFGPLTLAMAKDLDRETDFMMCAAFSRIPVARRAVDEELLKRFGYSRLSEHPHAVAKRVIRKGAIANDDEARVVQDVLTNVDDLAFRAKSRQTLDRLLHQYEPGKRTGLS